MTSEQIAELRKADPIPGGSTFPDGLPRGAPLAILPYDSYVRLLDEREALLEALKNATEAIAGEWGESSAADLRAAIAKARSP